MARYARNEQASDTAEVAVTVIDDWQRRGLGTLLLEVLSARAREEGITSFTALMLATNDEMMDLLRRLYQVRVVDREIGTVEIAVPIPTIGIGASVACDGQILVLEDMLGLSPRVPKFVKRYGSLGPGIEKAVADYAADVRSRAFPGSEHVYPMKSKKG